MDYNTQAPTILLRSPNWVGDAIMATPVVHALKKSMPHCTIHVLAKAWVSPIWQHHPYVEKVITLDQGSRSRLKKWITTVSRLRQVNYDMAIILPNSFSSAWLLFWAGIKNRIGYRSEGRRLLLTQALTWTKSHHQLARPQVYLNLTKGVGVDMDFSNQWQFTLQPSQAALTQADRLIPTSNQLTIGIAPGSVAPSRRWSIERYAQLIGQLQQKKYRIVLLGSPSDQVIADKVAKKAGGQLIITAGQTDLALGSAVIKKMDLVISNDSGAMHMAYASHVPVLVLQGAADPSVTGPFGSKSAYIRNETLRCSPCVKNECPKKHMNCMKTITVDEVFKKVQEMLR